MGSAVELENKQRKNSYLRVLREIRETGHAPLGIANVSESDLIFDWLSTKWKPLYRARRLEEYQRHVERHYEQRTKENPGESWILPRLRAFGRRGRKPDVVTQKKYDLARRLVAANWKRAEIRAKLRGEFEDPNPSQTITRALRKGGA